MDGFAKNVASRGARVVLLVCLTSLAAACSGSPPPTEPPAPMEGYDVSILGHVSKTYDADFDAGVATTKSALTTLGFHVVEESGALFEKTFDVESQDGTSVLLAIAAVTKSTTKISIKVGYLLGNRDAARRIHSEIEAELAGHRAESVEKARRWGRSVTGPTTRPSASPGTRPSEVPATPRPR